MQTFGLEDTIPVHIQLTGPLESLSHIFPSPDSEQDEGSGSPPDPAIYIRVGLVRKTLIELHGRRHWRTRNIGEGKVWPTPPHFHGELSVDWEGEVRCSPEIRTSGFNIGTVAVQVLATCTHLLFSLTSASVCRISSCSRWARGTPGPLRCCRCIMDIRSSW